jgi:hypothetical protein
MMQNILLATLLFAFHSCFSQQKKDSIKIELSIVENEKGNTPPPPVVNLNSVNIFVLKNGKTFYYYDSSFIAKNKFDEYRIENLNLAYLHTVDLIQLKEFLRQYLTKNNIKPLILAVEDNNSELTKQIFKKVLKPLKTNGADLGYITKELYEILKKIN